MIKYIKSGYNLLKKDIGESFFGARIINISFRQWGHYIQIFYKFDNKPSICLEISRQELEVQDPNLTIFKRIKEAGLKMQFDFLKLPDEFTPKGEIDESIWDNQEAKLV